MKTKLSILSLIFIIFLGSCISDSNIASTNMTKVDRLKDSFTDSEYLSSVNYMVLDSSKNALFSKVSKIIGVKNNYCFVCDDDKKIILFDSNGKLIREIKRIGRGKGEYTDLSDVTYDKYNDEILLLTYPSSIMHFTSDGDYIRQERLDGFYDNIGVDKSYIYLSNNTYVDNKLADFSITCINKANKEEKQILSLENEYAPYCINGRTLMCSNGNVLFSRKFDNHLYYLKNGAVDKSLEIDFSSLSFPKDKLDHQYDCTELFNLCYKNKYIYIIDNMVETDNYIIFSSNLWDMIIYNKANKSSIHYNKATLLSMGGISNLYYTPVENGKYDFCFIKDAQSISAMKKYLEKHGDSKDISPDYIKALEQAKPNSSIAVFCKFK